MPPFLDRYSLFKATKSTNHYYFKCDNLKIAVSLLFDKNNFIVIISIFEAKNNLFDTKNKNQIRMITVEIKNAKELSFEINWIREYTIPFITIKNEKIISNIGIVFSTKLQKDSVKKWVDLEKKRFCLTLFSQKTKSIRIDTTVLNSFKNKTLSNFYKSTNYRTVWQSEKHRKIILEELLKSDEEGLNPEDYKVKKLLDFEKLTNLDAIDVAKYDILLTSSLEKYISHITNGTLNPRKLYKNWDLKENYINLNETITKLLNSDSLPTK